jgi:signal transduction histidine kinase/CheY-like chemotaxis protein
MRIPTVNLLKYAKRSLFPSLQPWLQRNFIRSKYNVNRNFLVPHVDANNERLFNQERQTESLENLKTMLLLGASCFLIFITMKVFNDKVSSNEIIIHSLALLTIGVLLVRLHHLPLSIRQINKVTKLSAALFVTDLTCLLIVKNDPAFYTQIWIGLLPIYFFTYGQMFMTIAETLKFGLLIMIILPLIGYLIGVDHITLLPSIITLAMINIFGFCTRCQLEAHSRNLFLERRKAENRSEDKTQFLRELSHNLRQPLQALACYTSALDTAFSEHSCETAQQITIKLGSVIDDLNYAFNHILDIANLEAGTQVPQLSEVDINRLLTSLENQFSPQATLRGLKLKVHLRSRPPYTVYSDASILSQILSNLIDNAIKYTSNGWIVIAAIKIGNDQLKLHVRDCGIGIADALQGEIFKEFFRCHRRQVDDKTHGLGIGLTYALKATERLPKHSLKVYSKLHQGSDFQLCLPSINSPAQRLSTRPQQPNFTNSFVFVVGNQLLSTELTKQLTSWGCLVQKAESLDETLAALAENIRPPDLLITHFYLSKKETAHDIIAAIQADCGQVPTLILSSHAILDEDKAKWPENTVLLRKPASEAALMTMLTKAMGK